MFRSSRSQKHIYVGRPIESALVSRDGHSSGELVELATPFLPFCPWVPPPCRSRFLPFNRHYDSSDDVSLCWQSCKVSRIRLHYTVSYRYTGVTELKELWRVFTIFSRFDSLNFLTRARFCDWLQGFVVLSVEKFICIIVATSTSETLDQRQCSMFIKSFRRDVCLI